MDGMSTADFSTSTHFSLSKSGDNPDSHLAAPRCPMMPAQSERPPEERHDALDEAFCELPDGHVSEPPDEREECRLIRSFDQIFQLQQRSEEIRSHLENIDRLLFNSRTVAGLVGRLIAALEGDFDLVAARILFRHDHPIAEIFKWAPPRWIGIAPPRFVEHESLIPSGPFVLDDPNGNLSRSLFGEATPLLSSALVANLCVDEDELGLLCLGSDDPNRYCGGMNMDLIASLADKIALGIQNAWDHESRDRESFSGCIDGIYSESFFREYLTKEFNRSWRSGKVFSLMALSLGFCAEGPSAEDIAELIRSHIRSSDVAAEGDSENLWILLPETDLNGAQLVAERLTRCVAEEFDQEVTLHFGITLFSRDATAVPMLMSRARAALQEAEKSQNGGLVESS